jgi:hypothetical protein
MQSFSPDLARRVRTPGYLVMALLVISPLIELGTAAWPFQVHEAAWRLSFAAAAGASLGLPVLGLFLAFLLATFAADAGALLVVTGTSIVTAILCLLQAGLFALDALEMKSRVRPGLAERYGLVSSWWLIKLCAVAAILFIVAVSALRANKRLRRERRGAAQRSAALLVGSPAAAPRVTTPPSAWGKEEAGAPL